MERQEFEALTLCPLDGRYSGIMDSLSEYFSEYALVKYRVFVEIQWLKFLIENVESDILARFNKDEMDKIKGLDKGVSQFFDHRDPAVIDDIFGESLKQLRDSE